MFKATTIRYRALLAISSMCWFPVVLHAADIGDVLTAVETELARLKKQPEQEHNPEVPVPSDEVAYLLLSGLAAQGEPVLKPSTEERSQFGLDTGPPVMVQLVTVGPDARLVKRDVKIQVKSSSYRILTLALYRRRDGKWVPCGAGRTTAPATKFLGHASRQLLIDGWTREQVQELYGKPTEKNRSQFMKPAYGHPKLPPEMDEQWYFPLEMGHRLVCFKQGKVVLAIEEWSDF